MRLYIKLPVLILVMMIVFSCIMAALLLRFQRETTIDQFHQSAAALNTAMRTSIDQDMLMGGREYIERGIARVAEDDWVSNVTIYTPNKSLYASAGGLVSHHADTRDKLADVLTLRKEQTQIISTGGLKELHTIAPILNAPECSSPVCHDSNEELLGAIDIGLDMSRLDNQLMRQNVLTGVIAILAFLLMGGALSVMVRRTVLDRLGHLSNSALDISMGEYSARVDDTQTDEIGILGRAFNEMAERVELRTKELQKSQHELARWNIELNERVQLRTRELSAYNEIARAVSHSLDLNTIIGDVLEKMVPIMQAERGAIYLLNEAENRLYIAGHRGYDEEHSLEAETLDPGSDFIRPIIASGNAAIVDDILPKTPSEKVSPEAQEAYAVAPLRSKGKLQGVLVLYGSMLPDITSEALQMLTAMGQEIGIGIDNAMTAEKLRAASDEIHNLLNMAIESGFQAKFENPYLAKCWEERNCTRTECPAYYADNLRCWQIAGAFSERSSSDSHGHLNCPVYEKDCADEITAIGEAFNNMMFLLLGKEKQLVRHNIELSVLVKCAEILSSTVALRIKLQQVIDFSFATLPGAAGILFLHHQDADSFSAEVNFGCDPDPLAHVTLEADEWVARFATPSGEIVTLDSVQEIEEVSHTITSTNFDYLEKAREGLTQPRNVTCASLLVGDNLLGILSLFNIPDLDMLDASLIQTLADLIAVAIENDRLYQEVQSREQSRGVLLEKLISAQEEERRRVARELHDEAGQAITALMMSTSMAAASFPEDMKAERARFLESNELAKEALSRIRKVISELRPSVLDDLGLVPAIRAYARQNLESMDIETELELDKLKQRLPPEVEVTVFRVAQEAFTNIVRHSEATRVLVRLIVSDSRLELKIEDNGKGFAPAAVLSTPGLDGGWGLRGMQERINLLSGSLDISSVPGDGTTITIGIPLLVA